MYEKRPGRTVSIFAGKLRHRNNQSDREHGDPDTRMLSCRGNSPVDGHRCSNLFFETIPRGEPHVITICVRYIPGVDDEVQRVVCIDGGKRSPAAGRESGVRTARPQNGQAREFRQLYKDSTSCGRGGHWNETHAIDFQPKVQTVSRGSSLTVGGRTRGLELSCPVPRSAYGVIQ